MLVHFGVELLRAEWPAAVVCVGTFDGVHLGHQRVVRRAINLAESREQPGIVVTFDRHPAAILHPDRCPKAIASLDENLEAFEKLGAALALVLPFDLRLSETRAQEFLDEVLIGKVRASCLVVGHDFAFGKGREGTSAWLEPRVETVVMEPFELDGKRVSSSEVRLAVEEGRVHEAARWLGRPFEIKGIVVPGARLGRKLGYPTINLARSFDQVIPADGIYAGRGIVRGESYRAAISVGLRPTVGGTERTIEAFLLEYPGSSLYGASVSLQFSERIRDEIHFGSLDELRAQIELDVKEVALRV